LDVAGEFRKALLRINEVHREFTIDVFSVIERFIIPELEAGKLNNEKETTRVVGFIPVIVSPGIVVETSTIDAGLTSRGKMSVKVRLVALTEVLVFVMEMRY
jgi:hypothetical protein